MKGKIFIKFAYVNEA